MKARSDQKSAALSELKYSSTCCLCQPDLYNQRLSDAKNGISKHLFFDFAEQLVIPTTTHQMGPMCFKIGQRSHLFGSCDTSVPCQTNYIYDENETIGSGRKQSHGRNSVVVVSMLDNYLKTNNHLRLTLHADNCCGQKQPVLA